MKTDLNRTDQRIRRFVSASLALWVIGIFAQNAMSQTNTFPSSGAVGIGTTSPGQTLHVVGAITAGGANTLIHANVATMDYDAAAARFISMGPDSSTRGVIKLAQTASDGYYYLEPFIIDAQGNVGIGTNTPSGKLEVVGDLIVSGNISAKYQDLAEWVSTKHTLPAGTVVSLDTQSDNGIVPSSIPYDTHVAGVVSDSPGIILGIAGPGKLKIATTGRVKVHVDASNGPIRRGDLLVTGTREGTAMRSEMVNIAGIEIHRPGTLIGKALEPLETGEGEILVLLSLQ